MEQGDAGQERVPGREMDVTGGGGALRSALRRQLAATRPTSDAQPPTGPKADLYRGFGDGFTRAFELAVTPVLFGLLGYLVDRWAGTVPVFTTIFALVCVIGMLLRTWYGYVYKMETLEKAGSWANAEVDPADAATADAS